MEQNNSSNEVRGQEYKPLARASGSAKYVWVKSGKSNGITWDEYKIKECENSQSFDRDDVRLFEHHPEKYDAE